MGFLSSSKELVRLTRLRRELESEPRPHGIAELARAYLALGENEVAQEVIDFGRTTFPESDDLKRVASLVTAEAAKARLSDAKEAARHNPTVQSWLELADVYKSMDRIDLCTATLREALERFGDNGTVLTQLGEIRLQRFMETIASTDALAAESLLRRALEIDPEALKPRYLLAELCFRVGAFDRSRTLVEQLLQISPQHERGRELANQLVDVDRSMENDKLDFYSLLMIVEERMSLNATGGAGAGGETGRDSSRSAGLSAPDDEFLRISRSLGAGVTMLIDSDGPEWGTADDKQTADSVRSLSSVMNRAARGMELGVPARVVVEGSDGALVLEQKRNLTFALVLPGAARVDAAAVAARDALERLVRD